MENHPLKLDAPVFCPLFPIALDCIRINCYCPPLLIDTIAAMQFTLKQLLADPSHVKSLTANDIIRLKTDLEHFIEHEHVLTQHIRRCQTTLLFGNYSESEIAHVHDEIAKHQTTIFQLRTLYDCVCKLSRAA